MAEILAFPRPGRPASQRPRRTAADDTHDACCWVEIAGDWGWHVGEYATSLDGRDYSGFVIHHAAGGKELPLFTLIRQPETWALVSRQRERSEHDTLVEALQAVFPTEFTQPLKRQR